MTLVDLYVTSVRSFTDRVAAVGADQWAAATPCPDWDVRALVNHVVYEQRWSVPLLAGATIAEVGDQFDGDLLGDDPAASAGDAAKEAVTAVADDAVLNRTVHLSFGDTPATEYLRQLFADHLIHSWDLCVATGQDRTLDQAAVRECLAWFTAREDLYRSSGAIGPRVQLEPLASDQDRLLAAFGRDPRQ
jgi:uncharacterized protein (TIGR03086 family)